jgi:tetratricopeptide (TPR) repeat protein
MYRPDQLTGKLYLLVTCTCLAICAPRVTPWDAAQGVATRASSSLSAARALAASGQFPEAIAAYQKLLAANPRTETAELELAACYRKVHNEDEARRILQQARREHPRSAAAAKALGNFEIEAQSYDSAITALRAAVGLAPADLEARNFLASAYQSKGDATAALIQLDYVLAHDPQNGLALYLRAQIHADAGDDDETLVDAEKLIAVRPDYPPARVLLGKVLIRLKQCVRAAEMLRPAQNGPPLDTQALFQLANAHECAGDADSAKAVRDEFAAASQADRTRAENETQSKHLTEQANELARQNQFAQALGVLQQALEKDPKNGFAYSQQSKIYFSQHETDRAREAIQQALALQPYQPDFLYVAGVIAENDGKADEALRYFERVTQVNPKEADAFFEIGKIRLQQGDRGAALAAFRKATALDPSDLDYKHAVESISSQERKP